MIPIALALTLGMTCAPLLLEENELVARTPSTVLARGDNRHVRKEPLPAAVGQFLRVTAPASQATLEAPPLPQDAPEGAPSPALRPVRRVARAFYSLRIGDRVMVGPGGKIETVFFENGLRWKVSVPANASGAATVVVAGSLDAPRLRLLSGAPKGALLIPQRAVRRRVLRYIPAENFQGAAVLKARGGGSYFPDYAVRHASAPLVIGWKGWTGGTSSQPSRLTFLLRQRETGEVVHQTSLTPDVPDVTVPEGTLAEGALYRWNLDRSETGPFSGRPGSVLADRVAFGTFRVLTPAQREEIDTLLADARDQPREDPTDPTPELLAAGVLYQHGLFEEATAAYEAAFKRCPLTEYKERAAELRARPFRLRAGGNPGDVLTRGKT